MKKIGALLLVFSLVPTFLFAESTFRSIKATSTGDNPGVLNVESSYKFTDNDGNVTEDNQSNAFNIDPNSRYTFVVDDDKSAKIDIKKVDTMPDTAINSDSLDSIGFDDFSKFNKKFDEFFNDFDKDFYNFDQNFYNPSSINKRNKYKNANGFKPKDYNKSKNHIEKRKKDKNHTAVKTYLDFVKNSFGIRNF